MKNVCYLQLLKNVYSNHRKKFNFNSMNTKGMPDKRTVYIVLQLHGVNILDSIKKWQTYSTLSIQIARSKGSYPKGTLILKAHQI